MLGAEHPDVAASLNNLAVLYQVQEKTNIASELITRATEIEELNLERILTIGSEERKQAYMATLAQSTYTTLSFHFQKVPNTSQVTRLALTTVLRRKGRVLDAVSNNVQTLRQHLTRSDQSLLEQLNTLRTKLTQLIFQRVGNTPIVQYRTTISTLKTQAEELENTLARRSAEFRIQSQPITITAVQQQIPKEAALVELVLYQPYNFKATQLEERWGKPRYAAYVLQTQGDPKWVDLGEAVPIDQAVTAFRQALASRSASTKSTARKLDQILMQPVRQLLGNTRQILLSPDSQLNLIPFAALVDESDRYLVENYSITYLSSGRDLLRLSLPTTSQQPPVILANPTFDQPGRPLQVAQSDRGTTNRRSGDISQLQFGPLPGTGLEAEAIVQKLKLPASQLLTGTDATENRLN